MPTGIYNRRAVSEEAKKNMSLAQKKRYSDGEIPYMKGKKVSKKTREKISLSSKGKKLTEECRIKIGVKVKIYWILNPGYRERMKILHTGKTSYWKGKSRERHVIESMRKSNLGSKHTEEHRRKISNSNLGKKMSEEARSKLSKSKNGVPQFHQRGDKNVNWKGGVSPEHARIRKSAEMCEWKRNVFKRDNYTCQDCGQKSGNIRAHHVKQFCFYPELRFDLDNGKTLCETCHNKPGLHHR